MPSLLGLDPVHRPIPCYFAILTSPGINLAFTKALYKAGCGVLIADLSLHKDAESWLSSVKDSKGPKIHFHRTDVTDWNQLEEVFNVFEKEYGDAPDIVVPGAGVYEPSFNSFWGDVDKASHYKLFDINLLHPIKMTRIAVRKMQRAGKPGVVIHLSSISAQRPSVTVPLYSVSKQGISQFIRSMAPLEELANVRVVGVAPG
jgi:3-hydroxybutyrate dehydrogenase